MSTASVVEAPAAEAPPGTPVAVYACLANREFRDSVLRGVEDFVPRHGWVPVETFVDISEFASPADERPERARALALAACGEAKGVVAPSYSMLRHGAEERAEITDWQERTGAWVSSPWNSVEVTARLTGVGR
ncbi:MULTISPECIES: hypothetical protein [unclassified Streptomyces]|uniref:hypothetical protein n=1 Tax=unclassified Streptomyces TaxID=2593676 RepID=UPI000DB974CE|nr:MULTISPECIES: hypothetical protein [unclassified Streptomyces]MYT68324.1 hypothetical protein [Streptomyces sp. SID8367]RAJ76959.1 hypothetical protein K377_06128 [Streptomyces sp. PsTaAH-137]